MADRPPVVLTIAGFDPSSGAGVTADIKTIAAHGCYGVSCITAMTVQSTAGVRRVEAVEPALVTDVLEELASDIAIAAVHIGMLVNGKVVKVVAEFLGQRIGKARLPNVVLDPILKSSSGANLLDAAGTKVLVERLIPLVDVITPNIDEAAVLAGMKVTDLDEMRAAAGKLHEMGSAAVVITGGHLDKAIDLLSFDEARSRTRSLQGREATFQFYSRHWLRLCNRLGVPSSARTRTRRSRLVGEDIRDCSNFRRTYLGARQWSGSSSVPHA